MKKNKNILSEKKVKKINKSKKQFQDSLKLMKNNLQKAFNSNYEETEFDKKCNAFFKKIEDKINNFFNSIPIYCKKILERCYLFLLKQTVLLF